MNYNKAFTLVELIVVVTVISILTLLWFIWFTSYLEWVRDTKRISQVSDLYGRLLAYEIDNSLPMPDDYIEIKIWNKLIWYQWYLWKNVLKKINYFWDWIDPKDDSYLIYSMTKNKKSFALVTFLESDLQSNNLITSNMVSANNDERFPYIEWKKIGIILNESSLSIHEIPKIYDKWYIDLNDSWHDSYNLFLSNEEQYSWTGWLILKELDHLINKQWSCKSLLRNWKSYWNWKYTISPKWWTSFETYCDMENGWYTALFSVNPAWTTWSFDSTQWLNPTIQWNDFMNEETTFNSYSKFNTNTIKICRGDLDKCYEMNHNKWIPLQQFYADNISYIDFSHFIYNENYAVNHSYNINYPDSIGEDKKKIFLNNLAIPYTFDSIHYNKYGAWINIYSRNKLWLQADNNNNWPWFDNVWFGIWVFAAWPNMDACSWIRPIDTNRTLSVLITGWTCYYDNPDNIKWYVLWK
jgi:prepilin-type N-terminal cleavage/methylation domain-containing protein